MESLPVSVEDFTDQLQAEVRLYQDFPSSRYAFVGVDLHRAAEPWSTSYVGISVRVDHIATFPITLFMLREVSHLDISYVTLLTINSEKFPWDTLNELSIRSDKITELPSWLSRLHIRTVTLDAKVIEVDPTLQAMTPDRINFIQRRSNYVPPQLFTSSSIRALSFYIKHFEQPELPWGRLDQLVFLSFQGSITLIPNNLADLHSLQYLDVESYKIEFEEDGYPKLPSVKYLTLPFENEQATKVFNFISSMTALERLYLDPGNFLIIPKAIAKLPHLVEVRLFFRYMDIVTAECYQWFKGWCFHPDQRTAIKVCPADPDQFHVKL